MLYRTDDSGRWGSGIGRDLNASEIDGNFWELRTAINNLIANPGAPINIASITGSGNKLTFNMSDGTTIGPIYLPVLEFKWRDVWEPTIAYSQLDVFRVIGVGLYLVLQNHISDVVFDPNFQIAGSPAYLEMFAFAPAQNLIYDIGFYYPGRLSNITSDVSYLYQEPAAREFLLPIVPQTGSAHQAYLQTPPATIAQAFSIYRNDIAIGTINFAIGANLGSVTINADTTFEIGDRLAVGKSASDTTAAGLSVVFAAQQVII